MQWARYARQWAEYLHAHGTKGPVVMFGDTILVMFGGIPRRPAANDNERST